jgi:hypothetical protein
VTLSKRRAPHHYRVVAILDVQRLLDATRLAVVDVQCCAAIEHSVSRGAVSKALLKGSSACTTFSITVVSFDQQLRPLVVRLLLYNYIKNYLIRLSGGDGRYGFSSSGFLLFFTHLFQNQQLYIYICTKACTQSNAVHDIAVAVDLLIAKNFVHTK